MGLGNVGLGDESVGVDIASPFGLRLNPPVGKGCKISAQLTRERKRRFHLTGGLIFGKLGVESFDSFRWSPNHLKISTDIKPALVAGFAFLGLAGLQKVDGARRRRESPT